jgi:hydroxymethylbilane synthase
VVLAAAGLARIGFTDLISEIFEADEILPAPGQGALAVECRSDDHELIELLATIDHGATRAAVTAERRLLAALEAGCSAPVGAYATSHGTRRLRLDAVVLGVPQDRQGVHDMHDEVEVSRSSEMMVVREHGNGDVADPDGLGSEVAGRMLTRGAARLVGAPGSAVKSGTVQSSAATNREDAHDD